MSLVEQMMDEGELTAKQVDVLARVHVSVQHFLTITTETTRPQIVSLARTVANYATGPNAVDRITVGMGEWGLPRRYLAFTLWHGDEVVLAGGIDEQGRVST